MQHFVSGLPKWNFRTENEWRETKSALYFVTIGKQHTKLLLKKLLWLCMPVFYMMFTEWVPFSRKLLFSSFSVQVFLWTVVSFTAIKELYDIFHCSHNLWSTTDHAIYILAYKLESKICYLRSSYLIHWTVTYSLAGCKMKPFRDCYSWVRVEAWLTGGKEQAWKYVMYCLFVDMGLISWRHTMDVKCQLTTP